MVYMAFKYICKPPVNCIFKYFLGRLIFAPKNHDKEGESQPDAELDYQVE